LLGCRIVFKQIDEIGRRRRRNDKKSQRKPTKSNPVMMYMVIELASASATP
jgi:hypothetical protein